MDELQAYTDLALKPRPESRDLTAADETTEQGFVEISIEEVSIDGICGVY